MKKKLHYLGIILAIMVLIFGVSQDGEDGEDLIWEISLRGIRSDTVDSTFYEEAKQHASHYRELKFEKKGDLRTYMAMPLWMLVAIVDGSDSKHAYNFNDALWTEGYEVTITASDGYAATFNTSEYARDQFYLADSEDGKAISPTIVGDVPGDLWVTDVAEMELDLGESPQKVSFTLDIEINENVNSFSLADLEASPYYLEGKGSYTTSAGTTYTHSYGGIDFAAFLGSFTQLTTDSTITVVAMDGYEMSYSGEDLLTDSGGTWILAFKSDGEYLPEDPGYVRTVKIGPQVPNIDGHKSARMIKKIILSGEGYEEFTLSIFGMIDYQLDRSTVQSCVSCHKQSVTYFNKKEGSEIEYTGFPLWRLLAYGDDPVYAPHRQDSSIISYNAEAAKKGYDVTVTASDGFARTMTSSELHNNNDVIIAMSKEGSDLPENEWPLILVWDKDTKVVPEGIKSIRNVSSMELKVE